MSECRDCHGEGEMRWNPSTHPAWETSATCLTCNGTGEVDA